MLGVEGGEDDDGEVQVLETSTKPDEQAEQDEGPAAEHPLQAASQAR